MEFSFGYPTYLNAPTPPSSFHNEPLRNYSFLFTKCNGIITFKLFPTIRTVLDGFSPTTDPSMPLVCPFFPVFVFLFLFPCRLVFPCYCPFIIFIIFLFFLYFLLWIYFFFSFFLFFCLVFSIGEVWSLLPMMLGVCVCSPVSGTRNMTEIWGGGVPTLVRDLSSLRLCR